MVKRSGRNQAAATLLALDASGSLVTEYSVSTHRVVCPERKPQQGVTCDYETLLSIGYRLLGRFVHCRTNVLPTETIPFSWQIQFALINLVSSLVSSLVNLLINLLVASSCSSPVGRLFAVIHGLTSLFTGLLTDFSAGFLTSFTGLFTSLFTGLLAKMLEISLDNLTG